MNKKSQISHMILLLISILSILLLSSFIHIQYTTSTNILKDDFLVESISKSSLIVPLNNEKIISENKKELIFYTSYDKNLLLNFKCYQVFKNNSISNCGNEIISFSNSKIERFPIEISNDNETKKIKINILYKGALIKEFNYEYNKNYKTIEIEGLPVNSKIYYLNSEINNGDKVLNGSYISIKSSYCDKDILINDDTKLNYNEICPYIKKEMSISLNKTSSISYFCNIFINDNKINGDFYFNESKTLNYSMIYDTNKLNDFKVKCNNKLVYYTENMDLNENYFKNFKIKETNFKVFYDTGEQVLSNGILEIYPGKEKYYDDLSEFDNVLIPFKKSSVFSGYEFIYSGVYNNENENISQKFIYDENKNEYIIYIPKIK